MTTRGGEGASMIVKSRVPTAAAAQNVSECVRGRRRTPVRYASKGG